MSAREERTRLMDWLKDTAEKYNLEWRCACSKYDTFIFRIRFPEIEKIYYRIEIEFFTDSFNTRFRMAKQKDCMGSIISEKHWKFVRYPKERYAPSKNSSELFEDYITEIINKFKKIDHDEKILEKVMATISKPQIKKVIFNNPATIVLWEDGTKTVVKRQKGERWDKEKGLAMAIVKKMYGNTGNYNDIFKKWCEEEKE